MTRSSRRQNPITRMDQIAQLLSLTPTEILEGYTQSTVDDKITINPCPIEKLRLTDAEKMFNIFTYKN